MKDKHIMLNFKTFLQRALLAVALLGGAGAASAGPAYRVTLDTAAYGGVGGLLDFTFLAATPGSPLTTATLSNFSGLFGAEAGRTGAVGGAIPSQVTIGNDGGDNWLTQAVSLGASFSFDIRFDDGYLANDGIDASTFAVSLYNEDFSQYIGIDGPLLRFDLLPAFGNEPGMILVSDPNDIAGAARIPEPSELLLLLTALALMGMALRRKA